MENYVVCFPQQAARLSLLSGHGRWESLRWLLRGYKTMAEDEIMDSLVCIFRGRIF